MTRPSPVAETARNLRELAMRPYAVDERRCLVVLTGEVDLAVAAALKAALSQLHDLGYTEFVLDLSGLTHMDSTGLSVLVGLQNRLEKSGRLSLAAVPANIASLLSMMGLDTRIPSFPTVEAALAETGGATQRSAVALELPDPAAHPPRPEPAKMAAGSTAVRMGTDAGLVLGLASTALPFAESKLAEAERWLRILRRYGDAGRVLREAGVREAPFADFAADELATAPDYTARAAEARLVAVGEQAKQSAADRHVGTVGTVDVLQAVVSIYGPDFDRVLAAYGGAHATVRERLESV